MPENEECFTARDTGTRDPVGSKGMVNKVGTSIRDSLKRIKDIVVKYIAEILADDIVWLINENRRLISIHQSADEANYYCEKHFQVKPVTIDRRREVNTHSMS